jgi:hypothetical protein
MRYVVGIPYTGHHATAYENQRELLFKLCGLTPAPGDETGVYCAPVPVAARRLGREMYEPIDSRMLWEVELDPLIAFVLAGQHDIQILEELE